MFNFATSVKWNSNEKDRDRKALYGIEKFLCEH